MTQEQINALAERLAEARYTGGWDGELGGYYVCRDTHAPDGSRIFIMSPKDEGALVERMNQAYAAALRLTLPLLVEAMGGWERYLESNDDWSESYDRYEALTDKFNALTPKPS